MLIRKYNLSYILSVVLVQLRRPPSPVADRMTNTCEDSVFGRQPGFFIFVRINKQDYLSINLDTLSAKKNIILFHGRICTKSFKGR